jgi:hypothetical protein
LQANSVTAPRSVRGFSPGAANSELPIAKSIRAAENAVNKWCQHEKLAA